METPIHDALKVPLCSHSRNSACCQQKAALKVGGVPLRSGASQSADDAREAENRRHWVPAAAAAAGPLAASFGAAMGRRAKRRRHRRASWVLRPRTVLRQGADTPSSPFSESDDSFFNEGLEQLLAESRKVMDAQSRLADVLSTARNNAQVGWEQGRAPAPPPPMDLGDAPEHVRLQLEAAYCGSHPYPQDSKVEALWDTMSQGSDSQLFLGAWSPWRLRALGTGALQAALLGAGLARDTRAAAYAAEALERWSALATNLAGGLLRSGMPAADELLRDSSLVPSGRRVEAYVTHLTDDDYVLGAMVLAASLTATGTTRPFLALVTEGVSAEGRKLLHDAGWALMEVDLVGDADRDSQHIRGYFCKILLWSLPCHSVVYLDTDTVVVENLDVLFSSAAGSELAAVPDSQPHQTGEMVVQAGCMVVEPSPERFSDLWDVCCGKRRPGSLDSWKGHEQEFLTEYFDGDRGVSAYGPGEPRPQWRLLSAKYNFNVRYHLRPLYEGIQPTTAAVIHFACCKPWDPKQRHFAPPAYVELFLEVVRELNLPWAPTCCAMDGLRDEEQKRKVEKLMAERGGFD